MASVLRIAYELGRIAFFALIVSQCFLLASYPAKYKDDSVWYAAALFYAPSVFLWLYLMLRFKKAELRQSFCVWALYVVLGLIPNIGIVFGVAGNELAFNTTSSASNATSAACNVTSTASNAKTLGPTSLKATLCVTPLLLLLLMNTASDAKKYKDVVSKLCVQLAVDLLDAVEMIDIVLEEQEHNSGISEGFGIAMISVACFSMLLSPWSMIEINLDEEKTRKRTAIIRNIVEIIGVNVVFLVVRLVIVFKYENDESIFIAKNIIAIILSALEIRDLYSANKDDV